MTNEDQPISLEALAGDEKIHRLIHGFRENRGVFWYRSLTELVNLGDAAFGPLVEALKGGNPWPVREKAAAALGRMDAQRAIDPLVDALIWGRNPEAEDALVRFGEPAVGPLLEALHSEEGGQRATAALVLGRMGDPGLAGQLIPLLEDLDSGVRSNAATALGTLGSKSTTERLLTALEDPAEVVRKAAADALSGLGDVCVWFSALKSPQTPCRRMAVNRLRRVIHGMTQEPDNPEHGWLAPADALEPLLVTLADEDDEVRTESAKALGLLSDRRAVQPLIACLEDLNVDFRRATVRALGQIGDSLAVGPLIARLADEGAG